MLRATQGTIDAMSMAIAKGYAINIGGGLHHANSQGGEGFCPIADISLAIKLYQKFHKSNLPLNILEANQAEGDGSKTKKLKVMYVDLDVHMGNGVERDFKDDLSVYVVDFFNPYIYPGDQVARKVTINRNFTNFRSFEQKFTFSRNTKILTIWD